MDEAQDAEAVLGLGVDDGVPAGDDPARLGHLVRCAAEDLADGLVSEVFGEGGDVEGEGDLAAHGVDVAHGVGGGDGPELVGVVHEGGEEIKRKHHRLLIVELVYGGIVERGQTDQEVGVLVDLSIAEVTQDLR